MRWWLLKRSLVFKQNYQYWELYLRNYIMIHRCWKVSRWWLMNGGQWWVLVVFVRVYMILVSKLNKQYMIGLTQEPFDTNDDGDTEWNLEMLLHLKVKLSLLGPIGNFSLLFINLFYWGSLIAITVEVIHQIFIHMYSDEDLENLFKEETVPHMIYIYYLVLILVVLGDYFKSHALR